jgi:hypothetical protein
LCATGDRRQSEDEQGQDDVEPIGDSGDHIFLQKAQGLL